MTAPLDRDLIAQLYDIPLGERAWSPVLQRLLDCLRTERAVLMTEQPGDDKPSPVCLHGIDADAWDAYETYFAAIDPCAKAIRTRFPPGTTVRDIDLLPRRVFERTEFFNDFWRPQRIGHALGAHGVATCGPRLHFVLLAAPGQGPYEPEMVRLLQGYVPHLVRVLQLYRILSRNQADPDMDEFAVTYGLTAAEARLIDTLLGAGNLRAAAGKLRRSYHTSRAQLRAVFDKTGVNSQMQLMALLHGRGRPGDCTGRASLG